MQTVDSYHSRYNLVCTPVSCEWFSRVYHLVYLPEVAVVVYSYKEVLLVKKKLRSTPTFAQGHNGSFCELVLNFLHVSHAAIISLISADMPGQNVHSLTLRRQEPAPGCEECSVLDVASQTTGSPIKDFYE